MPIDNEEISEEKTIGNIFDLNILEKWKRVISKENYNSNIQDTFIIK